MIWVTTNGRPSNGAAALAAQDGFCRSKLGGKIKPEDVLINWGSSQPLPYSNVPKRVFNLPTSVATSIDKLKTFEALKYSGLSVVEWTTDKDFAQQWVNKGGTVMCRTKLTGHSGDGIIIFDTPGQPVPDAPLYTKYVFKEKEFRVHVVCGKVVDTARKIKDPKKEVTNWKVRSHANGFIFARNNIEPDSVRDQLAVATVQALLLDFGAVDIVQDKHGKYYVLEVNTAPGFEGETTVTKYADAFRAEVDGATE